MALTTSVVYIASLHAGGNEAFSVDTVASPEKTLEEVVVTSQRPRETIPQQTLSGEDLERLNSNSVADALRYFSGVQVKDYGGVGGIKTVNVRSMGTNHTAVNYDGVNLGNAQNGQIDLGQFSLDNVEAVSLHNGQKSALLQPASDFGSAASVYIRTRRPAFSGTKRYNLRLRLRGGSFDLINPSAIFEMRLSPTVDASVSGEWLSSSGKYKFRYKRVTPSGEVAYDTTAVRQNGDIEAGRMELNLYGTMPVGDWKCKAYGFISERGVPGAIVNNVWRRGERIWDANCFAQGSTTMAFGRFTTMENVKYAFYRTRYVNNDDRELHIDNLYRQTEIYLSTANMYQVNRWLNASVSYDFIFNTLLADMWNFHRPTRYSNLLNAAVSANLERVQVMAGCLYTNIIDRVKGEQSPNCRNVITPSVYVSVQPLGSPGWQVRAFYKRSFRMPTFNDLYYADMGNSKLEPERVAQYNVGTFYEFSGRRLLSAARVNVDAYYNRVDNKIVAYPKGQQFRWTMLNLGKVDIYGVDISGMLTLSPRSDLDITLRGQYTFQRAIDVTNPSDSYYRDQIPYIPRHSGSAVCNVTWRDFGLNYSWIYVGGRYSQQENILYNYVQPWYTSDLSASYDFSIRKVRLRALVEVNNLLGQDYDVIINYPMPKTNWRITLTCEI